jgi:Holliday junction resolvase
VEELMGAMQRAKGAAGERRICTLDAEFGFESKRSAPMQAGDSDNEYADVTCRQWPLSLLFREVKFFKQTPVNRFVREYVNPERPGFIPTLVYKDNGQPEIACLKYTDLLKILAQLRDTTKSLDDLRMQIDPPFAKEG